MDTKKVYTLYQGHTNSVQKIVKTHNKCTGDNKDTTSVLEIVMTYNQCSRASKDTHLV